MGGGRTLPYRKWTLLGAVSAANVSSALEFWGKRAGVRHSLRPDVLLQAYGIRERFARDNSEGQHFARRDFRHHWYSQHCETHTHPRRAPMCARAHTRARA